MTYWALNAVFLAVVGAVAVAAVLVRRPGRGHWRAIGLTAVPLLLLTAVFDNVMIAVGLVDYDPTRISGAFLGIAPLEDFAYAIAAVVLLPSLWVLLPSRRPAAAEATTVSGATT